MIAQLSHGIRLSVPPDDHIGRRLLAGAWYEEKMLNYVRAHLPIAGRRVIDCGAFIGSHALWFSKMCGAARVDAFEPNPAAFAYLEANLEMNRPHTVLSRPWAVGKEPGTCAVADLDPDNMGSAMVRPGGDVRVVKLDGIIPRTPVSLLKIDVEGVGADVLQGAKRMLTAHRPAILVECRDDDEKTAVEEVILAIGYRYIQTFNATPTHLYLAQ